MPEENGAPLVSGSVMIDQLAVMRELAGQEAYERALSRQPAEAQELWRHLMRIQWVTTDEANKLIAAVATEAGRDVEDFLLEVVRVGVERTLTGVWRVILRFTTDRALVSRTPLLYSKTYDAGTMSSSIEVPGRADLVLEGWPGVPKLDLLGLKGGIECVLRCAGRKDPYVVWERTRTGARFTATWQT